MRRFLFLCVVSLFLMAKPAAATNISMSQVVLRGLDKLTGRLSTMTVNVGEKAAFGALDVYVRVCYTHPPEEIPENAAFLEVVEKKSDFEYKVFSGWMFSSSPALSAMEHPVYDVWVLRCQGVAKAAPQPEPLVLKEPEGGVLPTYSKLRDSAVLQADDNAEVVPADGDISTPEKAETTDAQESAVADDEQSVVEESIVVHEERGDITVDQSVIIVDEDETAMDFE